jgi:hypothetical protein
VDTVLGFPGIRCRSRQRISDLVLRFPPRGPRESSSPASSVLSEHYDACRSIPHWLGCPRTWWYHPPTPSSSRPAARRVSTTPPGGFGCRVPPVRLPRMETTGSPTFPGNPDVPLPCSSTPAATVSTRPIQCHGVAPAHHTTRAPAIPLSRLYHTASALAVYAS